MTTPLTPEEEAALRWDISEHAPIFGPRIERLLATLDAARAATPAAPEALEDVRAMFRDGLRPWLRHRDWCNVKTDDPPDTARCKCGLAQSLRDMR